MHFMLGKSLSQIHQPRLRGDWHFSHQEPVLVKTNGCHRGETGDAGTRAAPAGRFHDASDASMMLQMPAVKLTAVSHDSFQYFGCLL